MLGCVCTTALPLGVSGAAESLVEKSPFLPPDFQAPDQRAPSPAATRTNPTNLELKGIFEIAGEYRFNIYDSQTQQGKWVRLNDETSGYQVVRYDRDTRSIALEVGGRVIDLSLKAPSDSPVAVSTASNNPQVSRPVPETRRRVVVPPRRVVRPRSNRSSDDEQENTARRRRPPPPPPSSDR